jgi:hypothetical protein
VGGKPCCALPCCCLSREDSKPSPPSIPGAGGYAPDPISKKKKKKILKRFFRSSFSLSFLPLCFPASTTKAETVRQSQSIPLSASHRSSVSTSIGNEPKKALATSKKAKRSELLIEKPCDRPSLMPATRATAAEFARAPLSSTQTAQR